VVSWLTSRVSRGAQRRWLDALVGLSFHRTEIYVAQARAAFGEFPRDHFARVQAHRVRAKLGLGPRFAGKLVVGEDGDALRFQLGEEFRRVAPAVEDEGAARRGGRGARCRGGRRRPRSIPWPSRFATARPGRPPRTAWRFWPAGFSPRAVGRAQGSGPTRPALDNGSAPASGSAPAPAARGGGRSLPADNSLAAGRKSSARGARALR